MRAADLVVAVAETRGPGGTGRTEQQHRGGEIGAGGEDEDRRGEAVGGAVETERDGLDPGRTGLEAQNLGAAQHRYPAGGAGGGEELAAGVALAAGGAEIAEAGAAVAGFGPRRAKPACSR
ncbi:MAG: hypothetical protein R3D59_16515 [Paracoccaceae bacterium]